MNFYLFNLRCFYYLALHEKKKKNEIFFEFAKKRKESFGSKILSMFKFLNKKI